MDDAFGAPVGSISNPSPSSLKNSFAQVTSRSLEDMAQSDRILPRQVGSGVMRGTQKIVHTDGSYITIGAIEDTNGEFGLAFYDSGGNLIAKDTGATEYKYDPSTDKNYYQNGTLPDGSFGAIFVKSGFNVSDVVS